MSSAQRAERSFPSPWAISGAFDAACHDCMDHLGRACEGLLHSGDRSQFFVMGFVAGIIGVVFKLNGMELNDMHTKSFDKGAADLLGAACVGMAQGIILVLGGTSATDGTVLNTILHTIGESMKGLPPMISAWLMYVFQSVFNFFVVSGSGQAALTMPIMAPLADIVGVSRQTAVLAFQLGDAFTNFIVPRPQDAFWARWVPNGVGTVGQVPN